MTKVHLGALLAATLLVACGSVATAPDAARPDAAPDAAVPGPVTITIYGNSSGQPIADASILFLDPDDSVVSDTTTDSAGVATADLLAGGTVLYFFNQDNPGIGTTVVAYGDVRPGNQLTFGLPQGTGTPTTYSVTVPAYGGAMQYSVTTPCGGTSSPDTTMVFTSTGCGASGDFYVAARDGSNVTLATLYKSAVPISAAINLTGTYTPVHGVDYTVTGLPASAVSGSVSEFASNATWVAFDSATGPLTISGSSGMATVSVSAASTPTLPTEVNLTHENLPDSLAVLQTLPVAATEAIDLTGTLIPWIGAPTADTDHATIAWSEVGDGTPDYTMTEFGVTAPALLGGLGGSVWYLGRPYTGPSLRVPHLPAQYDQFNVHPVDAVQIDLIYSFRAGAQLDAVRTNPTGALFTTRNLIPPQGETVAIQIDENF